MNILIVASKFPPEYSGPGVRIPRLYADIEKDLGAESLSAICNGIEYNDCKFYTHKGIRVHRIVASSMRKHKMPFNFLPAKLHHALAYFWENILTLKELNKQIDQLDLIHVLGTSGGTAASLWWAKKHNVPVLMELVTAEARPNQRFFLGLSARPPENCMIVTLTKAVAEECIKQGYKENQIWCRPNPINEACYKLELNKKTQYRSKLTPFQDDDIVISTVAKIIPQKNQLLLVKVLALLPPAFKLIIAGPIIKQGTLWERDKLYLDEIHSTIRENNLQDRVHIITDFVDSSDYMKASDIYAMPAWNEGFGTPMLEAMACGLPVVANKNELSFSEWITNGENGFLCDINDPQSWANAFEEAALIPEQKRIETAANIYEKASQKTIHNGYKKVINNLLNKKDAHDE